jgi:hypothetical protein
MDRFGLRIGGRGGIRTHEGLTPLAVFKTAALNHSATLPLLISLALFTAADHLNGWSATALLPFVLSPLPCPPPLHSVMTRPITMPSASTFVILITPLAGRARARGALEDQVDVDITAQTCALMPTALSRMRFIAFAHSSAVFVSSNTSVIAGDDSDCPRKNPGSSGAPSSREMLCTVLRTQAMFSSPFLPALLPPPFFFGLPPHGWCIRVLHLEQIGPTFSPHRRWDRNRHPAVNRRLRRSTAACGDTQPTHLAGGHCTRIIR